MTPEERQSIIDEAVLKSHMLLPQVLQNLIKEHKGKVEVNKNFYKKYPEFKSHTEVVAHIVESMEQKQGGIDHEKLMEDAVPKIRERLKDIAPMDFKLNRLADRTF